MDVRKEEEFIHYEKTPPLDEMIKKCSVCGIEFYDYRYRSEEQEDLEHSRCLCGYCRNIAPLGIISETGELRALSTEEATLLQGWADKYEQLVSLLNDVMVSTDPVTEDQEIRYIGLRFWFMDNQAAFAGLWHGYFCHFDGASSVYVPGKRDTVQDIEKHLIHPFLHLYEAEELCKLVDEMNLLIGNGEYDMETFRTDLSIMEKSLEVLVRWAGD